MSKRVLVTGAGGLHRPPSHQVSGRAWLLGPRSGYQAPEYEPSAAQDFQLLDLRRWDNCLQATAASTKCMRSPLKMGGIGYIENNKA